MTAHSAMPLRQQIFEFVRASGAVPRVDIARRLGISPASVTALTGDLIADEFLQEIPGQREAGRGRPPVALSVRPDAYRVAGVKISDRDHTAVIMDFAGQVLASVALQRPTPFRSDGALLSLVDDLLTAVCRAAGLARPDLAGLALGIPGFVDHHAGHILWSPVLPGPVRDLATLASARLHLPTVIDNDANLATLAELWFGAGRHDRNFAVVTIEHGVGMGLVIDHRLFRGGQGTGTELGHSKVHPDGALCRCGQRGCLEAYLADYALAREAATALGPERSAPQDIHEIVARLHAEARAGHDSASAIFRRAGGYLAMGLANVVNIFDPERIILSGARMQHDLLYADDVLADVARMCLPSGRPPPQIEVHAWGDLIWARGAAALALERLTHNVLSGDTARPAA